MIGFWNGFIHFDILIDDGLESTMFVADFLIITLFKLFLLAGVVLVLVVKQFVCVDAVLSHIHADLGRILINLRL